MNKVSTAWGSNKSQGGILGNDMESTYKDLFMIQSSMEVPDMYRAIDTVMRRINTYEYDYMADEEEARQVGCDVQKLNPCRSTRKSMELVEGYKLKINIDRAIGWMLIKIMESNLAPISIMPR